MPEYLVRVASEFQLLDLFLKSCDPLTDRVEVHMDFLNTRAPDVMSVLNRYPWVHTRMGGAGPRVPPQGCRTVDLTLLGSDDSSSIWVSKVFGIPEPSLVINPLHLRCLNTNPEGTPSWPPDPPIDSPP